MKKFQLSISAVPARDLRPARNNSRKHSASQIDQIVRSIREFGWTKPILVDGDEIVAGHGAREAALKIYKAGGTIRMAGSGEELPAGAVPVIDCAGWSEDQRRAYVIADNKIAENSEWDEDLLKLELSFLSESGFELDTLGFDESALASLLGDGGQSGGGEQTYSRKIEAPIYEPKGDRPAVSELFDDSKTRALIEEIEAADLPDDIREFLTKAAERHTVFNFNRVADFYASADEEVQSLMERSALVIIDFDQAIENGFVKLTKRLGDLVGRDYPNG